MLKILDDFRKILDDLMLKAMHKRVVLYGYGYTGRFLKWYAMYYHSIAVDYVVSMDMSRGQAYDQEVFRKSLFHFHYKDVKDAIVWLAEPADKEVLDIMRDNGYIENKTYFDFYRAIYGEDIYWPDGNFNIDIKKRGKSGKRDIQFLEWLEWKYGCNFLTAIEGSDLEVAGKHGTAYRVTTQKEIFSILDKCHCIPNANDAIFDYGCGKGGAIVSFLDYGFSRTGGIEYEPFIYETLKDNMEKLGLNDRVEMIYGDAGEVTKVLDKYNWFYFFNPFDSYIFEKCIESICNSYKRKMRKIHIISLGPFSHKYIEEKEIFRLTNQFTIETRQRVVDVFESYG